MKKYNDIQEVRLPMKAYYGSELIQSGVQEEEPETDYSKDYLTFVALEDSTFTFSGNPICYSTNNGATWVELPNNTASPTVKASSKILWKQTNPNMNSEYGIGIFLSTGRFNVEGNAMSLHYGDDFKDKTDLSGKDFALKALFSGNTNVVSAENLVLPATTLALQTYNRLFYGCTSLTTAPELPATTLTENCYGNMFSGCTNLASAPELPATTLTKYCYQHMFDKCASLNYIKCLATDKSAYSCTDVWVNGVASSGTFVKNPSMTSWGIGNGGIPRNWTIEDA